MPCKNRLPGITYFLCSLLEASGVETRPGGEGGIAPRRLEAIDSSGRDVGGQQWHTGKHLINQGFLNNQTSCLANVSASLCGFLTQPSPSREPPSSPKRSREQSALEGPLWPVLQESSPGLLKCTHEALSLGDCDPFLHLFYTYWMPNKWQTQDTKISPH